MKKNNKWNSFELFNDLPQREIFHAFLYIEKESLWLNNFLVSLKRKNNLHDNNIWLDLTLKYIYPLLKKWKLIVKISEKISWNWFDSVLWKWKIYPKEEATQVIEEIRKRFLEIKDIDKLNNFLEFNVQFIIPWGSFLY